MANDLDILMASGKGALSGAGMGAQLGSLAGPVGGAVGAGIGALAGGVSAGIKQNQANQAQQIPFVDPLEAVRLAQLEQTRKNVLTGSDVVTQNKISEGRNIGAAVQGAVSRNTGGDIASTMDALLKAQKNTQAAVNQGISAGQERLPYFDSAVGNLAQRISQRKLELDLMARDQAMAENAMARKEANLNANALLGTQGGTMTIDEMIAELLKRKQAMNSGGTPSSEQTIPTVSDIGATGTGMNVQQPSNSLFQNDFVQPVLYQAPSVPDLTGLNFR